MVPPLASFTCYSCGASCRSGESDRLSPMWLSHAFPCPQNKFQLDMGRSQTLKRVLGCFYFVSRFRLLEMCSYRNGFYFPVRVMLAGSGYIKIAPDNKYLRKYNGKVVYPSGLVRTGHKGPREVKCGYNIVKLRQNSVFKVLTLSQE